MSEFHPNRQTKVKTRLGLTRTRILESWPFLVWFGVALIAAYGYSRGLVFSRMNGAVDVYQENITPTEDGRLHKIYVIRGQYVEPGTLLAEMDSDGYRAQLAARLQGVAVSRNDEIMRLNRSVLDLEKEERSYLETQAADAGKLAPLTQARDRMLAQYGIKGQMVLRPGLLGDTTKYFDDITANIGEIDGRTTSTESGLIGVRKSLTELNDQIAKMRESAEFAKKQSALMPVKQPENPGPPDFSVDIPVQVMATLNDSERRDVEELKTSIELCYLRTTKGGTVDKLEKEVGEYAKAGESILRVVADPDQLVGFLPQEHIDDLKIGSQVWVTPAQDRHQIFETTISAISPRINSLADATSPLPNRRLYGRDVVIQYPQAALPAQKGGPFKLVPGQTIIIHTSKPGEIPLMNKVFHNDDINAQ